jgi:hypothetical protein
LAISAGAWLALGAAVLQAQDVGPVLPDSPTPAPIDIQDPALPPTAPGSPTSPTSNTYQRSWTNPQGQHTQLYERSVTDNGYSIHREQTWTNPDGTPLRQHDTTITETDPYNFQREKVITLRDGRTIEHGYTQSWDGTTRQRERTFSGPNGQTHNFQQSWTVPSDGSQPTPPPATPTEPGVPEQPASQPVADLSEMAGATEGSLETNRTTLQKLNPFASKTTTTDGSKPSRSRMTRPSGFTLGASARGTARADTRELTKRQPGQAETAARHQQIQQQLQQVEKTRSTGRPTSPRSNFHGTR